MPAEFGMEVGESEFGQEVGAYETGETAFEYSGEFGNESESAQNQQSATEIQEMELASELLEVTSEQELDRFLGNVIARATKTIGNIARSPEGQALGGILKQAAKKALPMAGRAVGKYFGGTTGGNVGAALGTAAGAAFGLELEGLSNEDREFETAKQFVRFASSAARQVAAQKRHHHHPSRPMTPAAIRQIARSAAVKAAKRYAPGLVNVIVPQGPGAPQGPMFQPPAVPGRPGALIAGPPASAPIPAHFSATPMPPARPVVGRPQCSCGHNASGRWHREGRRVLIHGV